ncbi:membrane protein [Exiguobacterium mexicanum]|nr:membrane protein [Exiguobacterium mexicanum]
MKHPLEQLVGVIGMLAILRYGYLFIDTDKTRGEILVWLVVGFAVIYILERVGKRLVRRLPIIRKRFLLPVYVVLLVLFLASFRVPRETVETVRNLFGW